MWLLWGRLASFVSEILAQIRVRGIGLDRIGQHKSLQDGLTLDKKEAIQHLTKLLVDQMQKWLPVVQADSGSQCQIAALQAEIAELKAKAVSAPQQEAQAPEGSPPPPLKQLLKETDLWLLTLLNCWLPQEVPTSGWRTTCLNPLVIPSTTPGTKP